MINNASLHTLRRSWLYQPDRIRLTLAEGGFTDYELVLLDLQKGEQKVSGISRRKGYHAISLTYALKSAEHLKRHPWGKVPTVAFPDGLALFASRTICTYLAKKYALPLLPQASDVKTTALFDQAQSIEMLYFAEPAGRLAFEKFVKKFFGLPPNEVVMIEILQSLEVFFDVAERILQRQDYMAGNDFTLVDIYYVPLIQRLFAIGHGELVLSRTAVSAWWDRCVSRSALRQMFEAHTKAGVPAGG